MVMKTVTPHTDRGNAIVELQNLTTAVVVGGAAATNLPLVGIKLSDTIQSVIMFTAGVPSDVTAEATISIAGNIQLATTVSTGNQLVVMYYSKPSI